MNNWHERFNYDPETGLLTWKTPRSNRVKVGDIAGSIATTHIGKPYERRYLRVHTMEGLLLAHRIIFEMMTGKPMPEGKHIDHRDNDGLNNKWENLRLCSRSQNMGNRDRNKTRVRDLPKGIDWHSRDSLYIARIGNRAVKYTKSLDEAIAARNEASIKHFGEFHRPSRQSS